MPSYRLTASPLAPIHTPAFTGPVVRSALGLACHDLGCQHQCAAHCLDQSCAYTLAFDSGSTFRIDTTDLDDRELGPTDRLPAASAPTALPIDCSQWSWNQKRSPSWVRKP